MQGAHPFDWVDYGDTGIIHDVDAVIGAMDLALPGIETTPHRFRALPSTGISAADRIELAHAVEAALAQGCDGGVSTHGAATLEETAFFLSCVLAPSAAVVVTGAQRPPDTAASDALPGLRAAVAAAAAAPGGVYVPMNGELFDAASAGKSANHALDAFVSPGLGPLGDVDAAGRLHLMRLTPAPPHRFAIPAALPRADVGFSDAGADGTAVEAFVAACARALVSAGLPPGRAASAERAALEAAAAAGVLVIQSSRAPRGRAPLLAWTQGKGILSGGGSSPAKARILAMLALAEGLQAETLQGRLLHWGEAPTRR